MLKITLHEKPNEIAIQLEGKVIGPWVKEFDQVWRSLRHCLGSRKLSVDLRHVTQMDPGGRAVLTEIHEKTGADFVADTPMTRYFAEDARHHAELEKERT